jgi:adenylate cyclase
MQKNRSSEEKQAAANGIRLTCLADGRQTARDFQQSRVVIGRSAVCDLVIDSSDVGRKHAEIVHEADGWTIRDLRSRTGTAVGGQRVTDQPLCDGDAIVLGPTVAEPVTITFQLLYKPAKASDRVVLCDDSPRKSVVARIDLKELERSLTEGGTANRRSGRAVKGWPPAPSPVPSDPLAAVLDANAASQLPVLSLFKQVGEILLVSENLDDMLQKVVNVAVDNLPGQRGVICLYDENTAAIEPKVYRAKAAEGDRPFMVSRTILREAIHAQHAMLITSAVDDPRFHEAASVHQMGIRAVMCVPLYHAGRIKGLIYVDSQQAAGTLDSRDLEVLTILGLMVAGGITQMSLRQDVARERAMRARLSLYNSPHVVEQILRQDIALEGVMLTDEYEVSVLFADLTGFTAIAENMTPGEVVHLLNSRFEQLVAAVFDQDGTLDKYIGDAVMAVFGAPLRQEDHARRAVATALAMRQLIEEYNVHRGDGPAFQMRIGINSGRVVAGDIGTRARRAYTVIGDAVNVASRLESTVAQPGEIVIGPATWEQVRNLFDCEPLAEVQLRGKRQSIRPYRVVRAKADH